jgi:hypothetical protein
MTQPIAEACRAAELVHWQAMLAVAQPMAVAAEAIQDDY